MNRWSIHRASSLIRHAGRKTGHGRLTAALVGCLLVTGYVAVAPYGSQGATG
ncbi:hypothetical protein ABIB51_004711, partial [Arthrobacter sp. UYCu712]